VAASIEFLDRLRNVRTLSAVLWTETRKVMRSLFVLLVVFALGCAEGVPGDAQDNNILPGTDFGHIPKNDMQGEEPDSGLDLEEPGCRMGEPGCECTDGVSEPCEGSNIGACNPGVRTCENGSWSLCVGAVAPRAEECNGIDDDCDGEVDEGIGNLTCGVGICEVVQPACVNGVLQTCVPGEPNPAGETCSGTDDNCNGQIDEGCVCTPGEARDCYTGPMSTRNQGECRDGRQTCGTDGQWGACAGEVLPSAEICDGLNNDCNSATADGSADPRVGLPCDGPDDDFCEDGTTVCQGGEVICNEPPGTGRVEMCNGFDDNCDGIIDNANLNDNPLCTGPETIFLGSVRGDTHSDVLFDSWYDEEWIRVRIIENSSSNVYLSATVNLVSAPGTDFDLYVYCYSCGGTLAGSSISTGALDTVRVRREDRFAASDTFDILIEVRHASSSACGDWELTVFGNTTVNSTTCF